jgi:hypothetical protein
VRSNAWICGRSLTGIVGSNPTGGMDVCVVLYKDSSMKDKKGLHSTKKMDQRGKPQELIKKKSRRRHGRLSFVNVVCCHVEVSARGWSLVQRSPTECGVSECDGETSIMRRPWSTSGLLMTQESVYYDVLACILPCINLSLIYFLKQENKNETEMSQWIKFAL